MKWTKEFKNNKRAIKKQEYVTNYFLKTKKILEIGNENNISVLQFICFNEESIMVSGIEEVISFIRFAIPKKTFKSIRIYGVKEKEIINKHTPILKIIGDYKIICTLENTILGILTARSNISTNVLRCIKQLKPHQEIIYMLDRSNSYFNQAFDGYAAYCGGIKKFVTKEQVRLIDNKSDVSVVGTIPHSIIQQYRNDINKLILDYYQIFQTKICLLLDFENNVIKTLETAKHNLHLVFAVRIDTSRNLIDLSLEQNNKENYGINKKLIKLVREWLDQNGFNEIKIIVSSGINENKIIELNQDNNDIDIFGIGSFFLTPYVNISADLVKINNNDLAKYGRKELSSNKLIKYN